MRLDGSNSSGDKREQARQTQQTGPQQAERSRSTSMESLAAKRGRSRQRSGLEVGQAAGAVARRQRCQRLGVQRDTGELTGEASRMSWLPVGCTAT